MRQMMSHINENKLINYKHHGSVPGHSTQTLILELHDKLVQSLEQEDHDTALILIDQSKAYDLILHSILNYSEKTIQTFQNYLNNRRQYMQIQNVDSDILTVGEKSITQGSILSCIMYLIFVLDIPDICHQVKHAPLQYRNCTEPNLASFVDDNFLKITRQKNMKMEQAVYQTMDKVKRYMDSNRMAINRYQSKILLVTKDTSLKENFQVIWDGKTI